MKRRLWLIWGLLLLAACASRVEQPSFAENVPPGETAVVTEVVDGDTIGVEIDGRSHRVRYIGVNTPERGDPFYDEATAANRELVGGETVRLVQDVSETDQYGRLLRYVYLPDGTFVNAALVRQGVAQAATFPPDVAHQEEFTALQEEARAAGRGLWAEVPADAPCTCGRNRYNCPDFETQTAAQACYDYCWEETGGDVHRLDGGNNDGVACESLP